MKKHMYYLAPALCALLLSCGEKNRPDPPPRPWSYVPTGIELDKSEIHIVMGETADITATVFYKSSRSTGNDNGIDYVSPPTPPHAWWSFRNSPSGEVAYLQSYTIENPSKAIITPIKPGVTTIVAKCGTFEAFCTVTVLAEAPEAPAGCISLGHETLAPPPI